MIETIALIAFGFLAGLFAPGNPLTIKWWLVVIASGLILVVLLKIITAH